MGKKNKGGINATRLILGGYDREMERFGVDGMQMGGRASQMSGKEYRSEKDVEKDLLKAAAGDASFVNALQSAAMSGKGKAKKILDKGIKNIGDLTNANNFLEKAAKRHGQGGSFSSPSDRMGLAYSMAKRDRNKMIEGLEIPDADDINAVKPDAGPSFDGEETDAMRKNREEVEAYEAGMGSEGTRIFGGDPASSAKGFSDEYKLNVARGLELSGKKTRGPESGLVPGEGF